MGRMCEKDKNEYLDRILNDGEQYEIKMWGVIMKPINEVMEEDLMQDLGELGKISTLLGANMIKNTSIGLGAGLGAIKANDYCYIGLTKIGIYFVVLDSFHPDKINGVLKLNYDKIKKIEIKKSLIPGRKLVYFNTEQSKMKLSIVPYSIGTDIQGQKEAMEHFCIKLNELKKN